MSRGFVKIAANAPATPAHKKYERKLCDLKKGFSVIVFRLSFADTMSAAVGAFII